MNKKIIFGVILLFFLFTAGFASALEITNYPPVPGLPPITPKSSLVDYINYWFGLGTMIAGFVALISFAIGGIQYITSAGNPGAAGDARDRIKNSILGMILLASSFILISTINPTLTTLSLNSLPGLPGVYYASNSGSDLEPALSQSNTSNVPEGYNEFFYKCGDGDSGTGKGPAIIIWKFPKPDFKGNDDKYGGVVVVKKSCGEKEPITGGSFRWAFETAGVYYFLGANCQGYMSEPLTGDQAKIAEPFKSNIKSIRILNDNNSNFGFILHNGDINDSSLCGSPFIATPGTAANNCTAINMAVSSMTIFKWNGDTRSSGNGISFFSRAWGKDSNNPGDQSGFYKLDWEKIQKEMKNGAWFSSPENMQFSYEGINVPETYKNNCKNFKECSGGIKIEGNYLVSLYTGYTDAPTYYCQVFRQGEKSLNNLAGTEFKATGKNLYWIAVIPYK